MREEKIKVIEKVSELIDYINKGKATVTIDFTKNTIRIRNYVDSTYSEELCEVTCLEFIEYLIQNTELFHVSYVLSHIDGEGIVFNQDKEDEFVKSKNKSN